MASLAVPVIDVASLIDGTNFARVSQEIHEACLEYGFFYVVNSGISTDLQTKVLDTMRQFFCLPVERKRSIGRGEKFRGYFDFSAEKTNEKADWKEGIYYFADFESSKPLGTVEAEFSGKNPWPDEDLPAFKRIVMEYFQKATNLGYQLMSAIAVGLGQEADFFTKKYTDEPFTQLALLHYPPHVCNNSEEEEVFGVGEHTDYGNLTLLMQDTVGGLQIQTKDGNWIDVPPIPDSLVINIGDMLEGWTSGAYNATRHRVKTNSLRDRFSVALFFDPSFECVVSPIPLDKTTIPSFKTQTTFKVSQVQFPVRYGDYVLQNYVKSFK